MNEGFQEEQIKKVENSKVNFDLLKKSLLITLIAISSMQESKGQNVHASYVSNEKSSMEFNALESRPISDAKQLETAIYNEIDTFEIKIANYYETDKPNISIENSIKISKVINEYLLKLDSNNIKEFLANDVVLRVSCDPRYTNFEGTDGKVGNLELAEARANTALLVINHALQDFYNNKLTVEEMKAVRDKFEHTKVEIPMTKTETGQGEDGVIDYHKVINSETSKVFTDGEWEELNKPENEQKLLEIYKNFRYATLVLKTLDKHPKEKVPENPFNLKEYKKLYVLFDDSPSMRVSKGYLAASLENNETNIPVEIIGFTSKIDTTFSAANVKEAAGILKDIKLVDDPDEWALDIIINKLQKIENNGQKELMITCTDEELQKVDRDKLETIKKLATEKNIDIKFSIRLMEYNSKTDKEEEHIYNVPLSKVEAEYQKIYDESINAKVLNIHRQIKITQGQLDEQYDLLGKINNQSDKRKAMREISSLKDDLNRLNRVLKDSQMVSLSNFK
jgi:hypothetical protein